MAKQQSKTIEDISRELQWIPNVGPRTAGDLIRLGIRSVSDVRGRDPRKLYDQLCKLDGIRHDICCLDVFCAAVDFANGKPSMPWWEYSRRRKAEAK